MNEGKEKEDIPREEKAGCSLILRIGRVTWGGGKHTTLNCKEESEGVKRIEKMLDK